ncbi:Hpt domain-containing protein [Chromobacterium violaceum]|uniref:Hpt domain-containing protein n=1 Tax=Chromobacterium violaceum TaxID=536 RepID=UPI0009B810E7|nr:Hpt domain-containing protein [Chromobacterium violaceum]MBP4050083.1 Hpt domain-containing protein [Chromobacterium violaceum]
MMKSEYEENNVSHSVLRMAIERIQADFLRLSMLFESGDYDGMINISHSLAGLSLYLNLEDLAACCSEIENISLRRDVERVKEEMENLREKVRCAMDILKDRIISEGQKE